MFGLCEFLKRKYASELQLHTQSTRMNEALSHRIPDDSEFWVDDKAGLAAWLDQQSKFLKSDKQTIDKVLLDQLRM